MKEKILATIELQTETGERSTERGQLFWRDGDIWCRDESGNEQPTQTGCQKDKAGETIAAAWGSPTWDLQWTEE